VATEPPLGNLAVRSATERQAHVLQLEHGVDGFAAHHLRRVLVDQVVAAFHGVEHVPCPVVLLQVAQRGANAALGSARMGAGRVELA
jgi:hypothetical protein